MNKRLCLFAASFLLSVPSAPMASANLVCIEGAAGGCTRWSNGHSCLRGTGLACSRWSNGLTCAQGGGTACVEWSNGVFCLRGVGRHCSHWSNRSHCVSLRATKTKITEECFDARENFVSRVGRLFAFTRLC